MDPESGELSRERAASSEPCSTRPNPYDDNDGQSSRKRQRLSRGTSRSRSADAARATVIVPDSIPLRDDPIDVDQGSSAPHTPTRPTSQQSPAEQTPSKVTINLRTARVLESIPSSPPSPISPSRMINSAEDRTTRVSVESGSDVQSTAPAFETPSSSPSDGRSPEIELVAMHEDDADFTGRSPPLAIIEDDEVLIDPMCDFPYNDGQEPLEGTVVRLKRHLQNEPIETDDCFCRLRDWINSYLKFTNDNLDGGYESYTRHREFWHALPDIVYALSLRRTFFGAFLRDSPPSRLALSEFFAQFAALTGRLVAMDANTLRKYISRGDYDQEPDLVSRLYLIHYSFLLRKEETTHIGRNLEIHYNWNWNEDITRMMDSFLAEGGDVDNLTRLVRGFTDLLPRYPKLIENCVEPSKLVCRAVGEATRMIDSRHRQYAEKYLEDITKGYQFFSVMSAGLETTIDKHVTSLAPVSALEILNSLTDILQNTLSFDISTTGALLAKKRVECPDVPDHYFPRVISMEWRFTILYKLITSAQMQLRVVGVTNMSTDLLHLHGQYKGFDPANSPVLLHFADFILQNKLIDYIVGIGSHPEIINESKNIFGFLVATRTYTPDLTDTIWRTIMTSQDPRVVEAIVRQLVKGSLNLYEYQGLLHICQKVSELPLEAFSPVLREFCEDLFQCLVDKMRRAVVQDIDAPPYELCVRLIRESSIIKTDRPAGYPEIQIFATSRLRYLLGYGPTPEVRNALYATCIEDISSRTPTTAGSICAINSLLNHNLEADLHTLTTRYGLTEMVIEELESMTSAGLESTNPSSPASQARRELLLSIITCEPSTISPEIGTRLWDVLVGSRSRSAADRTSAWQMLNGAVNRSGPDNVFIAACFKDFLPRLPPGCFTLGALDFAKVAVTAWIHQAPYDSLWEDRPFESEALEQLWRMILTAPPNSIDAPAIVLLVEVYLDCAPIMTMSRPKARIIHLALVDRCLNQLAAAAAKLKAFEGSPSRSGDEAMEIVATDSEFHEQETIFARSLAVLREFLKAYQCKPQFSKPKPRTAMANASNAVEGEPLTVKYQSFDGDRHTEVKALTLGKLNTAASLFASLQKATGFKNYKVFYGGKEFVPDEVEICKSLEDLKLNGLVLVQRREDTDGSAVDSSGSTTTLEGEIMKHLDELWGYLGMHEKVAQEIYFFLIKFPVYDRLLKSFENEEASHLEVFPLNQPFKCLYAVYALKEYIATVQSQEGSIGGPALTRAIALLVAAISDPNVLNSSGTEQLKDGVALNLIDCLARFLKETSLPDTVAPYLNDVLLERLLHLLYEAKSAPSSENSVRLISKSFETILEASLHTPLFWDSFKPHLSNALVRDLVLEDPRIVVRKTTSKQITDKCSFSPSLAKVTTMEFKETFWPILASLIPEAVSNPRQSEETFSLAHTLFKKLLESSTEYPDLGVHIQEWGELLLSHIPKEHVGLPDSMDIITHGLSHLLYCAASFAKGAAESLQQPVLPPSCSLIAKSLLQKHLFPELTPTEDDTEKISQRIPLLNSMTRRTMAETIFLLTKDDRKQYMDVLSFLKNLLTYEPNEEYPYAFDLTFNFERSRSIRSPTGYVGLRNLSNTCYLNSLFTQLFMNVSFRQFMLTANVADSTSQKLLIETQALFSNMQNSLRRYVAPEAVANSIRTYEETNIDVSIQMDVDEFYNLLFDRWEGQILSADAKKEFRSFYGGQLVQQVKSKECSHISERLEPFSAIQCDIKGKSSLQESLQAYVDGEIMEGDNKYKCSMCDRHVDAVKRACLKDVPDNLIFHLKRFDFNLRTLQRSKINDYFAFPTKIDMRPYKVEHLMSSPEECPEDQFELVGILVHAGTAESGHYYSFIRERPSNSKETWVEFNDDTVSSWKPEDMESSCFGGPDYRGSIDNGATLYDKNFSAYMLFYQRSSVLAAQRQELEGLGMASPIRLPISTAQHNHIVFDNELLMRRYSLHDPSHSTFVLKVLANIRHINNGKCSEEHVIEHKVLGVAMNHLDQVVARTKDLPDFPAFMSSLRHICQTCAECSRDYLEWFCEHPEGLRYLLLRNPEALVRTDIASSIYAALVKVKEEAAYAYGLGDDTESMDGTTTDPQLLQQIVKAISGLWDQFHTNTRAWPEYFGLLLNIADLGDAEALVLVDHGFLRRTLEVVTADLNLQQDHQYNKMLNIISKRIATRPVSYESVIALLYRLLSLTDRDAAPVPDDMPRFDAAAPADELTMPLSLSEHSILVQYWTNTNAHILTEKLLHIRQNDYATRNIIMFLLHWPDSIDRLVQYAIMLGIRKTSSFAPTGPFLRAALTYCEHSENRRGVEKLIRHVAVVARQLETNSDGRDFLRFFKDLQSFPTNLHDMSKGELFDACMQLLPTWAPGLLAHYEPTVRTSTAEYIEDLILKYSPKVYFGDSPDEVARATTIIEAARGLAVSCLNYLNDFHIQPRRDIITACCQNVVSMMDRCAAFFDEDSKDDSESGRLFKEHRLEVLPLLRKLTVEEADDEVSEWDSADEVGYSSSQAELNDLNELEVQLS